MSFILSNMPHFSVLLSFFLLFTYNFNIVFAQFQLFFSSPQKSGVPDNPPQMPAHIHRSFPPDMRSEALPAPLWCIPQWENEAHRSEEYPEEDYPAPGDNSEV